MSNTTNYNLGKFEPTGDVYVDIVSTLSQNMDTIDAVMANRLEYLNSTVVGRQIRFSGFQNVQALRFKLDANIVVGTVISISLDGGITSKPLKDIANTDILELEKGFYEVIADATFFTLRPSGGKKLTGDNASVASSVSGTTLKLTPPKGCFDGVTGNNVTITDADFIAGNIKENVNLFGKLGTLIPFNTTPEQKSTNFGSPGTLSFTLSFPALSRKPNIIIVTCSSTLDPSSFGMQATWVNGQLWTQQVYGYYSNGTEYISNVLINSSNVVTVTVTRNTTSSNENSKSMSITAY
jgi:hypothetical protein